MKSPFDLESLFVNRAWRWLSSEKEATFNTLSALDRELAISLTSRLAVVDVVEVRVVWTKQNM